MPARFQIGGKTGAPLANLPSNIRVVSSFGERAVISPNSRKIAFIGRTLGDAYEYDIATGRTRNLTAHFPHNGWVRVHYLRDGSYILIGTRSPAATWTETREDRLELFWMDAQATGAAMPLDQKVYEGVAVSRESNKIAWSGISARKGKVLEAGAEGSSTLYVGDVQITGGRPKVVNARPIKVFDWKTCTIEAQDFLPGDKAVLGPCYVRRTDGSVVTRAVSVAVADGVETEYPTPASQYAEVEGIFPDGKRVMVECSNDYREGLDLCVMDLKAADPRYVRITRVQDYGNYRFSNPTVAPDGTMVAFQFASASLESGTGQGILLMTGIR